MTRAQRILLSAVVGVTAVAVAMCVWRGKDARKAERKDRSAKQGQSSDEADDPTPDVPGDTDEPEAFDASAARAGSAPTAGGGTPTATQPAAGPLPTALVARAAPPGGGPRIERLHANVLKEAIRANWVTIDDSDTPCPPDRIRIVYTPPSNIKQYKKGAYFEPLGPNPGESTNEVNGLLVCEGHTFVYRGFEAYYRADSGRWDIFPFPVIEE